MFVYASKEFNNVVIQVLTVLEVDTTRAKVQVINGVPIPQQYNIKGEWVENGRYYVNDWVTYGNGIYLCINNITDSTTIPPLDKTNFKFIGGEKSIEKKFFYENKEYIELNFLSNKKEIFFVFNYMTHTSDEITITFKQDNEEVGEMYTYGNSAVYTVNEISNNANVFINKNAIQNYTTSINTFSYNKIEITAFDGTSEAYIKIKEYYE